MRRKSVRRRTVKERFMTTLFGDQSIDWDFKMLGPRTLILDVIYLLGVSISRRKYKQCSGFKRFLRENGIDVEMRAEKMVSDGCMEEHSKGGNEHESRY